jgi:hypothetical protein
MPGVRVPVRTLAAAAAATSVLCTAGGALAATAPAPGTSAPPTPPGLTFVPPVVGPICVNIGAIIIDGKVINPSLRVCTPGFTAPPIVWRSRPMIPLQVDLQPRLVDFSDALALDGRYSYVRRFEPGELAIAK